MKCENFNVITCFAKVECLKVAQMLCWIFFLSIICTHRTYSLAFDNKTDLFIQKCQMECSLRRDFPTCGKYKVMKWLDTLVKEKVFTVILITLNYIKNV